MVYTNIYKNSNDCGLNAAKEGAKIIRSCIKKKGYANIILATGISQ